MPAYGGRYRADDDILKDSGTSHMVVVDSKGNAVSSTFSINKWFGSSVISEKTGVLLNDHMDDFASMKGPTSANSIKPGRRPLSSMTPIFFVKDRRLKLASGAAGRTKIITSQLQTFYNYFGLKMDLDDAIIKPRLANLLDGSTFYEDFKVGDAEFIVDQNLIVELEKLVSLYSDRSVSPIEF